MQEQLRTEREAATAELREFAAASRKNLEALLGAANFMGMLTDDPETGVPTIAVPHRSSMCDLLAAAKRNAKARSWQSTQAAE